MNHIDKHNVENETFECHESLSLTLQMISVGKFRSTAALMSSRAANLSDVCTGDVNYGITF